MRSFTLYSQKERLDPLTVPLLNTCSFQKKILSNLTCVLIYSLARFVLENGFKGYLDNFPSGKLSTVVWVRVRVSFSVEGKFSLGTIIPKPF